MKKESTKELPTPPKPDGLYIVGGQHVRHGVRSSNRIGKVRLLQQELKTLENPVAVKAKQAGKELVKRIGATEFAKLSQEEVGLRLLEEGLITSEDIDAFGNPPPPPAEILNHNDSVYVKLFSAICHPDDLKHFDGIDIAEDIDIEEVRQFVDAFFRVNI